MWTFLSSLDVGRGDGGSGHHLYWILFVSKPAKFLPYWQGNKCSLPSSNHKEVVQNILFEIS